MTVFSYSTFGSQENERRTDRSFCARVSLGKSAVISSASL